ncbi:MAG: hypothetical protein LBF16_02595 [Pseudomonadales bacterium]|nr:hypothetical protein [Pseudomonadales bacterium]
MQPFVCCTVMAAVYRPGDLFIGGASVFPTTSAVSSSFIVHVLAMKSVRLMIGE